MAAKIYTPRPFAGLVTDHFAEHPRCALWAKPGMGKTVLTLNHLEIAYNVWGDTEPTLVVAPLRVARDGWAKESSKWAHLKGFEVVPITGGPEERKAALRRDAPVFTVSYDSLPWLVDHLEETSRASMFRRVVADEAHRLKGYRVKQGAARAQALGRFAHTHVKEFIELTGSPSPNGLKDLWGPMWFLDAGTRLGLSYSAFEERWFAYKRVRDAISHKTGILPVIMPFAERQIHEAIADLCLSLDPRDWFDLEDPIVNIIEVDLPLSARSKYRELERELFLQLGDAEVEVHNMAMLSGKCLQLANGAIYLDAERYGKGTWIAIHDEKIDALATLAEATNEDPLLVVYLFRSDLERMRKQWPDLLDLADAGDLERAKAGEGKIWAAHPQSVGEGVDGLHEWCNNVVFFGQTWRLDWHDQILERVGPMRQLQAGTGKNVFLHYIVARGTVDEAAVARRHGKMTVQEALTSYVKGEL